MDEADNLQLLMNDSRLVEMCALLRASSDVLEVVTLNENNHSEVLMWLFDAKEGHGQGDEILRDLLAAASEQASAHGCKLAKNRSTSKFFQQWPVARIRTSSFGAAFAVREFVTDGGKRLDLVVIDPQNKFLVVIENKSGTKQRPDQLDPYRQFTDSVIKSSGRLREYTPVYLALDRFYDGDNDDFPSASTWLHLGYDWLNNAAMRARLQVTRGNAAAQVVVNYCALQNQEETPVQGRLTLLASELHATFPAALAQLLDITAAPLAKQWLSQKTDEASLLFLLQNRGVTSALEETRGIASVVSALCSKAGIHRDNVITERVRAVICPTGWNDLGEDHLPVFIGVRFADDKQRLLSVFLNFDVDSLKNLDTADAVRAVLTSIEPAFAKNASSRFRHVRLAPDAPLAETVKLVKRVNEKLEAATVALYDRIASKLG